MRANPEEGREAHSHGTFLNGFHETWNIHYAEDAFGFAKTGQTIVNVPDAKVMKLYVDDEPLLLQHRRPRVVRAGARLPRRHPDPRPRLAHARPASGCTCARSAWSASPTATSPCSRSRSRCSTARRPVVVSSQMLNRQDGEDEYHVAAPPSARRPTRARCARSTTGCSMPRLHRERDGEVMLGYRCANSGMTLACGYRHLIETTVDARGRVDGRARSRQDRDHGPRRRRARRSASSSSSSYHTSTGRAGARSWPTAARGRSTVPSTTGPALLLTEQREWLDHFWEDSDVELRGDDAGQQAVRWNLFQLAQASAQTQEHGIAAKGVTGGGYEGHYFWDTEMYVVPFLAYTNPETARKAAAVPLAHAADGPPAGRRAEPARRAVPVANDQRRGGVGLLRRRHRAVPHQRRRRLRPQALPRRQRRRRVPRRRGRRDPRRDGPPVGGPRLLRDERRASRSTSTASPVPTSTRPSSTTTCTRT